MSYSFHRMDFLIRWQAWKTIRHPLIIQYLDHGVVKGKKFVLTEYVEPVSRIISSLEPEEIICGLCDIFKALDFLHQRCKLSHNNVSTKSLFFSRKSLSSWKLGCTQLMSSPDEETFDFVKRVVVYKQLNSTHSYLPQEDLTPEICEPIPSFSEIHRRDSFAMGCLIEQLLPELNKSELVSKLKSVKKNARPAVGSIFMNESIFADCEFLNFKESLLAFSSYSEEEKKNFVTIKVIDLMRTIQPELVASKVIPMLLTSRIIMLHTESRKLLHPHLFIPEPVRHESISRHLIPRSLFEIHVLPVITKLFMVRKIQLRLILLQYLNFYVRLVADDVLHSILIPNILLGLEDENDEILSSTYASLSSLVQIFGGDILKGAMKQRRKIFSNDVPRSSLPSSSCSSSSGLVPHSVRNHKELAVSELKSSCERVSEWSPDWGSSGPSSPNSVANSEKNGVYVTAYDNSSSHCADPPDAIKLSDTRIPNGSVVTDNEQKSADLVKLNRKKRTTGAHDMDIKAIEIQIPSEVEDLFEEMEPQVNFAVRSDQGENSRVNSHFADEVRRKDMFALKETGGEDGHDDNDDGDWSNDDDESWDQNQVNETPDRITDPPSA